MVPLQGRTILLISAFAACVIGQLVTGELDSAKSSSTLPPTGYDEISLFTGIPFKWKVLHRPDQNLGFPPQDNIDFHLRK